MEVDVSEASSVANGAGSVLWPSSSMNPEPCFESPPPPLPILTRSGRPRREYRLPKRFHDNLPEPPAPVPVVASSLDTNQNPIRRVILIVRDRFVSAMNSFGIWRDYPERPTRDPDSTLTLADLQVSSGHHSNNSASHSLNRISSPTSADSPRPSYWPFANATIHSVMKWLNNGETAKSETEVTKFIHEVVLSPTFNPADLMHFDTHRENQQLDKALSQSTHHDQFLETSVDILVPSGECSTAPKTFTVPGLLHRSITSVIREAFESPLAHLYHYSPFKLFRKSPISGKNERVYGEIFTSDAFLAATEEVRRHAPLPSDDSGCKREKVVAALMFSSDATMLDKFGISKAWPIYLMLGNLSKYIRAQPDSGAMHHVAYIPSVSFSASANEFPLKIISCQDRFESSSLHFTQSGAVRKIQFLLIVAESWCMLSGQNCSMTTLYMHTRMVL